MNILLSIAIIVAIITALASFVIGVALSMNGSSMWKLFDSKFHNTNGKMLGFIVTFPLWVVGYVSSLVGYYFFNVFMHTVIFLAFRCFSAKAHISKWLSKPIPYAVK